MLKLGSSGLRQVPTDVDESVRQLYLENNNLTELGTSLNKLSSLEVLDVSANSLSACPPWPQPLSASLTSLRLRKNQLEGVLYAAREAGSSQRFVWV